MYLNVKVLTAMREISLGWLHTTASASHLNQRVANSRTDIHHMDGMGPKIRSTQEIPITGT